MNLLDFNWGMKAENLLLVKDTPGTVIITVLYLGAGLLSCWKLFGPFSNELEQSGDVRAAFFARFMMIVIMNVYIYGLLVWAPAYVLSIR